MSLAYFGRGYIFSTFAWFSSETGLSIACIFYLFVFHLLNIFFSLCCSLFCVLLSVYVCSAFSNRKGREGPSIHLLS